MVLLTPWVYLHRLKSAEVIMSRCFVPWAGSNMKSWSLLIPKVSSVWHFSSSAHQLVMPWFCCDKFLSIPIAFSFSLAYLTCLDWLYIATVNSPSKLTIWPSYTRRLTESTKCFYVKCINPKTIKEKEFFSIGIYWIYCFLKMNVPIMRNRNIAEVHND